VTEQKKDQTAMEFHLNILKARMENAYQKILVRENSWAKDLTQDNEHP